VNIFSGNIFVRPAKKGAHWASRWCGNFLNTIDTTVQTELLNDKKTG